MSEDIEPDTKDWTWVLERPCPDCDFDAGAFDRSTAGAVIREDAAAWTRWLSEADVRQRPDPRTWSPLEYACHVRDVHLVFAERLGLMLDQDDPRFANWDQDARAVEERYGEQDPTTVASELKLSADAVATSYDGVRLDQWERRGFRSNGSVFTVDSLLRYHLHDVLHHAHDVGVDA